MYVLLRWMLYLNPSAMLNSGLGLLGIVGWDRHCWVEVWSWVMCRASPPHEPSYWCKFTFCLCCRSMIPHSVKQQAVDWMAYYTTTNPFTHINGIYLSKRISVSWVHPQWSRLSWFNDFWVKTWHSLLKLTILTSWQN
jgi:hypothetical protein